MLRFSSLIKLVVCCIFHMFAQLARGVVTNTGVAAVPSVTSRGANSQLFWTNTAKEEKDENRKNPIKGLVGKCLLRRGKVKVAQ